ncbi:MAG: sulfotransferase, partial [Bacteroidota bacterium]
ALTMASPQEEELALASLGAPSSYLVVHVARAKEQYRRYISFEEASEAEIEQWKQAHRGFLRKLVYKHGNKRPLVLKSPANTARIPLLMEMYPEARFVHIHRHPLETIRSTLHLYDAWFQMAHFQSLEEIKALRDTYVLDTYEDLHRCWLRDKSLIPAGNLLEFPFAELKQAPIPTLEKVYDFLGDAKLDTAAVEKYLDSIATYRQNQYQPLSSEYLAEIKARMGFVFEAWSYQF